jgi:hypothetical protein
MFFLHLLIHKTIQLFIPANSFLFRFNFWKCLLLSELSLIKGTAKILFPVLSRSFIFYRWFLLQVCTLLLLSPGTKLSLG